MNIDATPMWVLWCIAIPVVVVCVITLRRDYIKRLKEARQHDPLQIP